MATANQDVNPVVFHPIDEANITFTTNQTLIEKCEGIDELKFKMFGKSVVKNAHYVDKKSTITLNLQTQDGSPFTLLCHFTTHFEMRGKPVNILSGLKGPHAVADPGSKIQGGKLYGRATCDGILATPTFFSAKSALCACFHGS